MATTLTKPPRSKPGLRLLEVAQGIGRVDAEKGIIYDAKVVGLESRNIGRTIGLDAKEFNGALDKTYSYSRQALESAIPKYEGSPVRIDHPASELNREGQRVITQRSRPALSTSGELKNVRMKEDGLYADLHLLKSHPHASFVLEVAQRMPDKLALSHNAYGIPVLKNGRAVIDQIVTVYSVDIVGDRPGTTNGLFESYEETSVVKRTIKQIFEAIDKKNPARALLLEMSEEERDGAKVAEMEMDVPAEMGTDDQVKAAFRAMVIAAFDDEKLDTKATLAKIKDILAAQEKLAGKAETPTAEPEKPVATEESDKTMQNNPHYKDLVETVASLKAKNDELESKDHVRRLLESASREVNEVRLNAVRALKTDAERKQLIESWPKQEEAIMGAPRPRTSAPLLESAADYQPSKDSEEMFRRAKNR